MSAAVTEDFTFRRNWHAEILTARPMILPPRHFTYPREAEEVERGALEVLVRPGPLADSALRETVLNRQDAALNQHGAASKEHDAVLKADGAVLNADHAVLKGHDFSRAAKRQKEDGALAPGPQNAGAPELKGTGFSPYIQPPQHARALAPEAIATQPFLATCALGFRDPAVPTGLWSCPNPDELCAVSGGYAYIIQTTAPEHFTMIEYRPVLEVRPAKEAELLLLIGHHAITAWAATGPAWQSEKLSDEGVTISSVESGILRGTGWQMRTDKETLFALDLRTGQPV